MQNGQDLIDEICRVLNLQDTRCYDTNIVNYLRNLTNEQLNEFLNK